MAGVIAASGDSAVTTKGQATIPKSIRDHLKIGPGDKVRFFVHPDGHVAVLPLRPLAELRGVLRSKKGRAVSLEEIDEGIAQGATARVSGRRKR